MICNACPRRCGADRAVSTGRCKTKEAFSVARIALHFWEEPPLSGTRGSGAVFFSGCNLNCVYCQNYVISSSGRGETYSDGRLLDKLFELEREGAHNINLVTPSHYATRLAPLLEKFKASSSLPVVYNSGGYDSVEALKRLDGLVDIYLPDMKYGSDRTGEKYSGVGDYFSVASSALAEMRRQRPRDVFDKDGIMKQGMIVRHLVLPANVENSKSALDFVARLDRKLYVSLMGQYFPAGNAEKFPELKRAVRTSEYDRVRNYFFNVGLENGFEQPPSDAESEKKYVPEFFSGRVKFSVVFCLKRGDAAIFIKAALTAGAENDIISNGGNTMEFKGSKTEQNLMYAFSGESQARTKYDFYASKAKKDGFEQISAIFAETGAQRKGARQALVQNLSRDRRHLRQSSGRSRRRKRRVDGNVQGVCRGCRKRGLQGHSGEIPSGCGNRKVPRGKIPRAGGQRKVRQGVRQGRKYRVGVPQLRSYTRRKIRA